jgi:hypothetical protein
LAQPPEVESTTEQQADETPKVQDAEMVLPSALPPLPEQAAKDDMAEPSSPSTNYFLKILVLFLVAIAVAALLRPKTVEPNPAAPEAATGQSMTSTVAAPPVDGVTPPEAAPELPADAAKGSVQAKPAAAGAAPGAAGAER